MVNKEIQDYIINNKIINDYFSKVQAEWKDDFKSHIYLIIFEMNDSKLESLYEKGELGKFIVGIITNQLKSKTSSFYNLYKKNTEIDYYSYNLVNDFKPTEEIIRNEINKKINYSNIMNKLKGFHPYHLSLFKLKYVDGLTIKQISEKLNIKYTTVYASIRKTEDKLKKLKWNNE